MCGINGIHAWDAGAPPVDGAELLRAREYMRARGPDGAGAWISPDRRVGFGHRRLAILDLSDSGAQPMASPDGRLVVTFNGEIYNFRELRRELEARGRVFRSGSDTEVLLHLYAEHGAAMVSRLRGMFAFAIWDAAERSLFLARDPFGIKPLYVAARDGVLRFASQVKALLAGGGVDDAPEPAGAVGFLLWGSVPEPYTLHRGIRALPAGSTLTVRPEGPEAPRAYFSVRDELVRAQEVVRAFGPGDRPRLAAHLADAVRHHLVADVPVAVFLSAGVDSNVIAALAAREAAGSLHSLTLGFEGLRGTAGDETGLAARSAGRLGLAHATRWIGRADFESERGRLLEAMDQPSIDGINAYFVCREAARAGHKVALSGLGGDELLGGYPSFRQVPRLARGLAWSRAVPSAGRLARRLLAPLLAGSLSPKLAGLFEFGGSVQGAYLLRRALHLPSEIASLLDPVAIRVGLERLATLPALAGSIEGVDRGHAKVAALESQWYLRNQLLRDADWAGMAHGVEVRVPFVDATLFRALAPWIVSRAPPGKADAGEGLCPPEILERAKTGFVAPVPDWLRGARAPGAADRGLRGWARQVLPDWPRQARILALVTDAWGAGGGIAQFNRNLFDAIAAMPECAEVVVLPRHGRPGEAEPRPGARVLWRAAGGKPAFVLEALRQSFSGPWDLVLCGHLHLTPLAALASTASGCPFHVIVHGVDAWRRHRSHLVNHAVRRASGVVGVSRLTLERFAGWSGVPEERLQLLPNAVDLRRFLPGPRPADLARALGLEGKTVIMTLGRLAAAERYKGIDEVMEALPEIALRVPAVKYLVCGDGDDRPRLQDKARRLGIADRVVFAGFVPEERKPEYYRLADAYVMPSCGEGFGIVFLEAMASGVPTVASVADGGREALLEGRLGILVDPSDGASVRDGILRALAAPRGVPGGLERYSLPAFHANAARIVREVTPCIR